MRVAVFGGTGYAGGAIASELEMRGHQVVRIARTADAGNGVVVGSIHETETLEALTAGAEVIVVAVRASATADNPLLAHAIPAIAEHVAVSGQRLGVVGGAGGLKTSDEGPRSVETPGFPEAIKPEAQAHLLVLDALEATPEDVDWFYLRPSQIFGAFAPGERTGAYRVGADVLLVDSNGKSSISGADFGIAFVDEIETPRHHRQSFTVGY